MKPHDGHGRRYTATCYSLARCWKTSIQEMKSQERNMFQNVHILFLKTAYLSLVTRKMRSSFAFATRQQGGRNNDNNVSHQLDPQDQAHTAAVTPDQRTNFTTTLTKTGLLFPNSLGLDRCTLLSPVCLTVRTTGISTWIRVSIQRWCS